MSALDRFLNSEYFVKKDARQNAKKTGIKSLVGKFEVKENELKLDAVKVTTSQSWLWAIGFKFLKISTLVLVVSKDLSLYFFLG